MKTKTNQLMADALHQITTGVKSLSMPFRRMSLLLAFVLAAGCFTMPTVVNAQTTDTQAISDMSTANSKTNNLFHALRQLSGYVLLVALISAGLMAAFGNYKTAYGTAIAAVIIYGGAWVLGLIAGTVASS